MKTINKQHCKVSKASAWKGASSFSALNTTLMLDPEILEGISFLGTVTFTQRALLSLRTCQYSTLSRPILSAQLHLRSKDNKSTTDKSRENGWPVDPKIA